MFPFVGAFAAAAASFGAYLLGWYSGLDRSQRQEADQMALETARELHDKSIEELSHDQFHRVQQVVKSREPS